MLTLITGPDAFLVRGAIERIRGKYDLDGLNTSVYDARPNNFDELVAAVSTPGFFGSGRVVIINDLMTRSSKGSSGDDDEETTEKVSAVDWPRFFGAIQRENMAILADRGLRAVPAAVKKAMPKDAEIVEGEPPRGSDLMNWMKERATASRSRIADKDARFLAELLCPGNWTSRPNNPAYDHPPDLELFANEIEKLALAAFPGAIEQSHIVEMTMAGQADRLFSLIDAVMAADGSNAITELSSATTNGDDAGRISAQLFQQIELIAALAAAGRMDPIDAGRRLGLSNPNRMLAISKSLRKFRGEPRDLLLGALEIERQFKSGVLRQPADQIYALVNRALSLSGRTREGGT